MDLNNPFAYIHIPPAKTGDKFTRLIVPVSAIKRFNYDQYSKDRNIYKDKVLKYKNEDGNKMKCFILCAADSFAAVQLLVNAGKRFRVPHKNSDTTLDSSEQSLNISDPPSHDVQEKQNKKRAKIARKELKKAKLEASNEASNDILNKYLATNQASIHNEVEHYSDDNFALASFEGSLTETDVQYQLEDRALRSIENRSAVVLHQQNITDNENSAVIRAYKKQIAFYKTRLEESEKAVQMWKTKYENAVSSKKQLQENIEAVSHSDAVLLNYYDNLYKYKGPIQFNEEDDCVTLLHNVQCKTLAYKNAFNSSKPIQMVRILMYGIYGYEDLLKRTLQVDNADENKQPLCNLKSEAVERELYRFLRLNNYNVHLIKQELKEVNKYFYNAISTAKLKNNRQEKAETALRQLQEQVQERDNLIGD